MLQLRKLLINVKEQKPILITPSTLQATDTHANDFSNEFIGNSFIFAGLEANERKSFLHLYSICYVARNNFMVCFGQLAR